MEGIVSTGQIVLLCLGYLLLGALSDVAVRISDRVASYEGKKQMEVAVPITWLLWPIILPFLVGKHADEVFEHVAVSVASRLVNKRRTKKALQEPTDYRSKGELDE
mgnify:FL=1